MDVEAADPAPQPRSPPGIPDLCGRHCLQAQLLLLTREIGFLEEEIQSIEGLQPASACCKEVVEYVAMIPEPLIPIYKKRKNQSHFWRRLCAMACFDVPTCCSGSCFSRFKRHWCNCRPTWTHHSTCCGCPCSCSSCSSRLKCVTPSFSCPGYSCGCVCSCSKCSKVCICPRCLCCISYCVCE